MLAIGVLVSCVWFRFEILSPRRAAGTPPLNHSIAPTEFRKDRNAVPFTQIRINEPPFICEDASSTTKASGKSSISPERKMLSGASDQVLFC
jgi:hypothetical protein